jgi:acyl carrier protein
MRGESIHTIQASLLQWCNNRLRARVPITADTDLIDSGYLDSILVMDVVLSIEKQYGVIIDSSEISPRHFRSVRTLAKFVASQSGCGDADGLNN